MWFMLALNSGSSGHMLVFYCRFNKLHKCSCLANTVNVSQLWLLEARQRSPCTKMTVYIPLWNIYGESWKRLVSMVFQHQSVSQAPWFGPNSCLPSSLSTVGHHCWISFNSVWAFLELRTCYQTDYSITFPSTFKASKALTGAFHLFQS